MKNEISEYEKTANDFLEKIGATLTTKFLKFDKHFADDRHKRNIFKATLSRNGKYFSVDFGSSLKDSLQNSYDIIHEDSIDFYYGLRFDGLKREYLSYSDKIKLSDIKKACQSNNFKFLIDERKATEIYNNFIAQNVNKYQKTINIFSLKEWIEKLKYKVIEKCDIIEKKNFGEEIQAKEIIHPTAYDILTCLTKNEPGTFENFCGDYGYDTDSRKAEKIYRAVCKEWEKVSNFFTPEELEELQEIN